MVDKLVEKMAANLDQQTVVKMVEQMD